MVMIMSLSYVSYFIGTDKCAFITTLLLLHKVNIWLIYKGMTVFPHCLETVETRYVHAVLIHPLSQDHRDKYYYKSKICMSPIET